jgi:RHH-type transcriptional regulator, proline utilization regulon repressor / proline dehydrogenase / delta 1-pyrroline-5-carboxylate dehydrogenase
VAAPVGPLLKEAVSPVQAQLLDGVALDGPEAAAVAAIAARLTQSQRAAVSRRWLDRLLQEYGIQTAGGVALLTLAEAYLRVPDAASAAELIAEKLLEGDWAAHQGASSSAMVNLLTRGLMVARALVRTAPAAAHLLRPAVALSMQLLGRQFVFGRDIEQALHRAAGSGVRAFCFSYDMLGESARTDADARRYLEAYSQAVDAVGRAATPTPTPPTPASSGSSAAGDGISVKLSALNCRYEPLQHQHVVPELTEAVITLARAARARNIGLTIDAEEYERLEMSLRVIDGVAADPALRGWDGLGFAVQAYQRRALSVIDWAEELSLRRGLRLTVRLVKGAYWDLEIQRAQQQSVGEFPVYTRKSATDVSYLACARRLLAAKGLSPAFATHNARTVATILQWSRGRSDVEFQRLHGMGVGLYERLIAETQLRCRIYAPVGGYAELLPYLVRRILENGANAGFIFQLANPLIDDQRLLLDPLMQLQRGANWESEAIVVPKHLYPERNNSSGIDLGERAQTDDLLARMRESGEREQRAEPLIGGQAISGDAVAVRDPADHSRTAGLVVRASSAHLMQALEQAQQAQPAWADSEVAVRSDCLMRAADLLEREGAQLMALAVREAGKTFTDALAEVREAVDFCRYYALQARQLMRVEALPGPTGERNEWRWSARGTFACISPWNFPLAIFIGQVAGALVTGNAVIAKPAPQTPLIAAAAVRLLLEAGVPPKVIAFLPGEDELGAELVAERRIAGVAFTGSNATARRIARALLADESRPLVPLIAETGGLNAMLVDSTALPEQVVGDILSSAFQSAGQRCSALRLLCLQQEIAPALLEMLTGAMARLRIGDPGQIDTDIGPVIDANARQSLTDYLASLAPGQVLYRCPLPVGLERGNFFAPTLVRLTQIEDLRREVFGPVLHVATWRAGELERTVDRINASGYGLTMGLQTRLSRHIEQVRRRARVGNLYVNRPMIGAVVGSQPFGGEGLSGTGPKAGGPQYLTRFMTERALSIDTTAAGGNVQLMRDAD